MATDEQVESVMETLGEKVIEVTKEVGEAIAKASGDHELTEHLLSAILAELISLRITTQAILAQMLIQADE